MTIKKIILFLFTLIKVAAAMAQCQLTGVVSDTDMHPAAGTTVVLYRNHHKLASTVTGTTGRYVFRNIEPGNYHIRFKLKGKEYGVETPLAIKAHRNQIFNYVVPGNICRLKRTDRIVRDPHIGAITQLRTADSRLSANNKEAAAQTQPGSPEKVHFIHNPHDNMPPPAPYHILISYGKTTRTAEQIGRMPTTDIQDIVLLSAGACR